MNNEEFVQALTEMLVCSGRLRGVCDSLIQDAQHERVNPKLIEAFVTTRREMGRLLVEWMDREQAALGVKDDPR